VATKMSMQTPQDLFIHELSDMLSAEKIIVEMLREASSAVSEPQLKQGLTAHLTESEQQARSIEEIFSQMGATPHPVICHAAEGLRQSLRDGLAAKPSAQVCDGLVTGGAIKTEHLEIAGYTGLIEKAQAMGQTEAVTLLQQNLAGEEKTLQKLQQISQQLTQQAAMSMQGAARGMQAGASTQ
jgi:ferritin-like metal-binding protein YciE